MSQRPLNEMLKSVIKEFYVGEHVQRCNLLGQRQNDATRCQYSNNKPMSHQQDTLTSTSGCGVAYSTRSQGSEESDRTESGG